VALATPVLSILALWYAAIALSGLPEFVIPRPTQVLAALVEDRAFIATHLLETLKSAGLGFLLANAIGIGLAMLFVAAPLCQRIVMPAAITMRNIPYVALASVLVLAFGDGLRSKVLIVALAGFFPVLVNTWRGLLAVDPIIIDRMRILDAKPWDVFLKVRLPFSLPFILAAQEIVGSGSIVVSIAAEWLTSTTGLGYVINRAMSQYRGDQVYAVALLAALLSYAAYSLIQVLGARLDWSARKPGGAKAGAT
ncbi:MAG: putative permease component of transporter, partial [Tardiphaga sp.]|nr:putative permease component of transporter [Tardiphaga sp.]